MPGLDKRQRLTIELHSPTGYRPAMVTFDAKAIQLEWERNAAEEISHEDQAAIQDRQYGELISGIIRRDLSRQFIESGSNFRLTVKHSLQITLHQLRSGIPVNFERVHELPRHLKQRVERSGGSALSGAGGLFCR